MRNKERGAEIETGLKSPPDALVVGAFRSRPNTRSARLGCRGCGAATAVPSMLRAARRMRLVGASGLTAALLSQRQLDERCRWYGACLRPAAGATRSPAGGRVLEAMLRPLTFGQRRLLEATMPTSPQASHPSSLPTPLAPSPRPVSRRSPPASQACALWPGGNVLNREAH